MNFSVRTKYFLSSLLLILIVVLSSGIYLGNRLRNWLEPRIESELRSNVYLAKRFIERINLVGSIETWDPIADSISATVSSRITIIAHDGTVLGDSDLTPAEVEAIENHGNRREVVEALNSGIEDIPTSSHAQHRTVPLKVIANAPGEVNLHSLYVSY